MVEGAGVNPSGTGFAIGTAEENAIGETPTRHGTFIVEQGRLPLGNAIGIFPIK
jgi:hypothetical protein